MAANEILKWKIVLVDLNPVKGKEMSKVRPCLIISPNAANTHLHTVIVAPLTSTIRKYSCKIALCFCWKAWRNLS